MWKIKIEPNTQGITQVQYEGNINANGSINGMLSQAEENINNQNKEAAESAKPSLRNPTDAELIFNATDENVGKREQIANQVCNQGVFRKKSLSEGSKCNQAVTSMPSRLSRKRP